MRVGRGIDDQNISVAKSRCAHRNYTRHVDGFGVRPGAPPGKSAGLQAVLAVDDEELDLRLGELPDPVGAAGRLEAQLLRGK